VTDEVIARHVFGSHHVVRLDVPVEDAGAVHRRRMPHSREQSAFLDDRGRFAIVFELWTLNFEL
jgi:hypothetical protein